MNPKKAFLALAAALSLSASAAERALDWQATDTSLALRNGSNTVWELVFDPRQPKTYFHPLATLDGTVLTAFRPPDHVWHRGLWWSWKFINGLNYWEEDKQTGRSQGVNELTAAKITTNADYSARAELAISYHPPDQPPVLTEARILAISAPDERGCYRIDWTSVFTAGDAPVKLDRTPPAKKGGVSWGGYAGLSLRFPPGIKDWAFLNSAGHQGAAEGNSEPARWVDFSGPAAGIAVFDHPANLRHPSPWYLNEQLPYFSPALLYNEPLELAPKQELKLRYRILVHPGRLVADELDREGESFGS
jgi:hypothetical protein